MDGGESAMKTGDISGDISFSPTQSAATATSALRRHHQPRRKNFFFCKKIVIFYLCFVGNQDCIEAAAVRTCRRKFKNSKLKFYCDCDEKLFMFRLQFSSLLRLPVFQAMCYVVCVSFFAI